MEKEKQQEKEIQQEIRQEQLYHRRHRKLLE
jgi:hypothetical protein